VPQDKVFRLSNGAIEEIPVSPQAAGSVPTRTGR
jgi:hypothetical protein